MPIEVGPVVAEGNVFDDHFLDVVGVDFAGSHPKGLAEWIKNSIDAYNHEQIPEGLQAIVLDFDVAKPKRDSVFRCVDFVGMTKERIDSSFKRWGDPEAARRPVHAGRQRLRRTLGGHGNGGKLYMRQMFNSSTLLTYRAGKLNAFGFDGGAYGYRQGLKDVPMTLEQALEKANVSLDWAPAEIRGSIERGELGFTVVVGRQPKEFRGRATVETIVSKVRMHPQVSRLLQRRPVYVRYRDTMVRLQPEELPLRLGYEKPVEFAIPDTFGDTEDPIDLTLGGTQLPGVLKLRVSNIALVGERAAQNAVDFLCEDSCVATHKIGEMGVVAGRAAAETIFGECECPALEALDCVRNDREKLAQNALTDELLAWVKNKVEDLASELMDLDRQHEQERDFQQSAQYNHLLNDFTSRFVSRTQREIQSGGDEPGGGSGPGGAGQDIPGGTADPSGGEGTDHQGKDGGERGHERPPSGEPRPSGDQGAGAGDKSKKTSSPPKVLLSNYDADWQHPGSTEPFQCLPRQPEIYQRPEDFDNGYYWINTTRPLASHILDREGQDSDRWREYLFQRHVDVIIKDALYSLQGTLTPEAVDQAIDQIRQRVMDAAAQDLKDFLFQG